MNEQGGGVGFAGLLTILFIGLKLTGCIHWSWVWVLSPIWILFLLIFVFVIGIVLIAVLSNMPKKGKD